MIRQVTLATLVLALGLAVTGCSGGTQPPQNNEVIKSKEAVDKSGKKRNTKAMEASL